MGVRTMDEEQKAEGQEAMPAEEPATEEAPAQEAPAEEASEEKCPKCSGKLEEKEGAKVCVNCG